MAILVSAHHGNLIMMETVEEFWMQPRLSQLPGSASILYTSYIAINLVYDETGRSSEPTE